MGTFQRLIFASLVCVLPAFAIAQSRITSGGPSVTYGTGGATVSYPNDFADLLGRSVKNDNLGGGVKVTDSVSINTSRGAVNATATRAASSAAIARGAAVAARALPYVGAGLTVGSLLWDLLKDKDIRIKDGQAHEAERGDPDPDTYFVARYGTGIGAGKSPLGACAALQSSVIAQVSAAATGGDVTGTYSIDSSTVSPDEGNCLYSGQLTHSSPAGTWSETKGISAGIEKSVGKFCPPSIDPLDPTNNIPEGQPVGEDGKCKTARYSKPLTDAEVAERLEDEIKKKPDKVPLVKDILNLPGGAIDAGPTTTAGPGSVTGPAPAPVVTNTPAGPETRTESPAIKIRYRGDDITWEPEVVTTRRPGPNPGDPDEVTEEKTGDDPSADPGGTATPDPCIANPKRAGCSELGDVEDPEWDPDEKAIELKPEAPWGSDDASCPPPRILSIAGHQIPMEWTLWCQLFAGIRYAIVAGAWIAAILIFLGGKGGES